MHAIETLAAFVTNHPKNSLPASARESASLLVADLMAATAAGLPSLLAQSAQAAALAAYGDTGPSGIWLTGHRSSVTGAAMANAAAASSLDIDDGHRGAAGHAGAGVIPTALAVGEALGASDADILDAIALGYDVALRVATSRPTGTFPTYSSGLWLTYGVAATAGRLLGLDAKAMAEALGIAGGEGPISFANGVSRYQGTTVKEVIPPAVVAGITAAYRSKSGATGPLDLLDNPNLFRPEVLTGDLGKSWWLEGCYLKPYACCRYMHAAVDAILDLRRNGAPIKSLRIETFPQGLKLSNERAPKTLESGQYSYYFSCALAALHGASALQPVASERLQDKAVLELAARVELVAHPDFKDSFPVGTPCRVIMDQGEGPHSKTVLHPLGDVANPMSRAQVTEKFRRIGAVCLSPARQDQILTALDGLLTAGFAPLMGALGTSRS